MFVDRESELSALEAAWRSERAELIVVYGQRRVGKTALLRAFCDNHPSALWVASLSSEGLLRRSFTDAVWQADHPDGGPAGYTYESWERAFRALGELAAERRLVVVIDEFPYLINANPSIPSVLQKVWDERLQHTRLMLILCGSHIGMMERELLEYRAPLYGRRTGQIHLRPLPLRAAATLFPTYLEVGHTAPIARLVADELSQFAGPVFENICRDWVAEQAVYQRLPFIPQRIGAWWNNEEEIDVVAIGEGSLLVGECKWTNRPIGANILDDLKRKAHVLVTLEKSARAAEPSASGRALHYALFARAFTPGLEAVARDEGILLVGLNDLLAAPPGVAGAGSSHQD